MKVYVASSWRNPHQPSVVDCLRTAGFEVYDFRNPWPGNSGFHWSEIDPAWETWTAREYRNALNHPVAKAGFKSDFDAMKWADAIVLVLPCGRSAHLELGWAAGAGKKTCVYIVDEATEPELMVKMCDRIAVSFSEVVQWLHSVDIEARANA